MSDTNSIWPNGMQVDSEGYAVFYPMGTNKIEIPKNSPHWPKGNKLISSFVYDDNKLVCFCDTKAMTSENKGIVVMPYEYIDTEFDSIEKDSIQIHAPKAVVKKASWAGGEKEDIPDVQYKYKGCKNVSEIKAIDANYLETDIVDGKWTELLSDLTSGGWMFHENQNLTSFTSDLSSLTNGDSMFQNCLNLTNFEGNLNSLTNGQESFYNCSKLTHFKSDLKSLTNGHGMFYNCENISDFKSDLSSLTEGYGMFHNCKNLLCFESDLKSLTNGDRMFRDCSLTDTLKFKLPSLINGYMMFSISGLTSFTSDLSSLTKGGLMFYFCKNITTFKSNLKSLTNGNSMFNGCSNLNSFKSNLSSLIDGTTMFTGCKLDASSIKNIIDTINTVESANLTLGMGCNNKQSDKDIFAKEVGYSDMTTLLTALQNKGWTVTAQYNGRPTSNYSLRQSESLPVFVKLVEITSTDEDSQYEYTSADETKFYNLDWFHETTGSTDGYETFQSLEEAIIHYNIKPIEK